MAGTNTLLDTGTVAIPVPDGGTGVASTTAYAPVCGGTTTTGALQAASSGISNSGYVLTSTGASSLPTWQAAGGGGSGTVNAGTTGQIAYYASNGTAVSGETLVPISAGGTNSATVVTAPTATSWAGWDANANMSADSFIPGYTTTATAGGTTTLTVDSTYNQYFTGASNQTVVLPVTSTLVLGQSFRIVNRTGSGNISVQSSGANTILNIQTTTAAVFTCILTSGTTAASWSYSIEPAVAVSAVPVINGGTGAQSVQFTPGTSKWMGTDTNGTFFATNFKPSYTTTATAAGTTTLTVTSTQQQFFTGATTQTVVLPVTSTLSTGYSYVVTNNSTGAVTVQSSGANNILVVSANTSVMFTCILASGTTAASWSYAYLPTATSASSGYVWTANATGTSPTWQAAPGSGGLVKLGSATASSSASLAFTGLGATNYRGYQIILSCLQPATNNVGINITVSTNNGASYLNSGYRQVYASWAGNGSSSGFGGSTSGSSWNLSNYNIYNGDTGLTGHIYIDSGYNTVTSNVGMVSDLVFTDQANTYIDRSIAGGWINIASIINAISFQFGAGNITTGTITVYGLLP